MSFFSGCRRFSPAGKFEGAQPSCSLYFALSAAVPTLKDEKFCEAKLREPPPISVRQMRLKNVDLWNLKYILYILKSIFIRNIRLNDRIQIASYVIFFAFFIRIGLAIFIFCITLEGIVFEYHSLSRKDLFMGNLRKKRRTKIAQHKRKKMRKAMRHKTK